MDNTLEVDVIMPYMENGERLSSVNVTGLPESLNRELVRLYLDEQTGLFHDSVLFKSKHKCKGCEERLFHSSCLHVQYSYGPEYFIMSVNILDIRYIDDVTKLFLRAWFLRHALNFAILEVILT